MTSLLKQLYIITTFLFISFALNAQKISLAELHTMSSNKNWETSNKYLLSKGWEYYNSKVGDDENYNEITWSYQRNYYDDQKANGWFYIYTFDGLPNKVMYRFRVKEYYTGIKNQLTTNGYKLVDEEILDKRVIAKYANSNYVLELTYSREETDDSDYGQKSFTAYEVTVYKKGGVYDPNNGKKVLLDEDGKLDTEYTLKDGKVNGEVKWYNKDGSLKRIDNFKAGFADGLSTTYYYNETDKKLNGKYFGSLKNDVKTGKWQFNAVENNGERNLSYENYINDIKEGDFRDFAGDSLIYGTYKNDQLNGKYIVYRDLNRIFLGNIIQTDTTKLVKTSEGHFLNNKKTGYWKEYSLSGLLKAEGNYIDSLKTGVWKVYYEKYVDDQGKQLPYSGKLHTEESYVNGLLDGKVLSYSFLNKIEVPCENKEDHDCFVEEYTPINAKVFYSKGLLDGLFEMKNEKNEIITKGLYSEGRKTGEWTNSNISILSLSDEPTIEKGFYISDLKEGKWERFDFDNKLIESYSYKKDIIDGEHLLYSKGRISEKRLFNNGTLTNLTLLDSNENTRVNYKITAVSDTKLTCEKFERLADGLFTTQFSIKKDKDKAINPATFAIDFETLENNLKSKDGVYKKETLDKKIIEEGNYANNTKIGTWDTYYYDQNIKTSFIYNGYGIVESEQYYDLKNNAFYSGEFLFKNLDSGITEERKIRDGFRHGTTRYKDSNGKTIKKETYDTGILKE